MDHVKRNYLLINTILVFLIGVAIAGCNPQTPGVDVAFSTQQDTIHVGQHATLDWVVVAQGGATLSSVTVAPAIGAVGATGSSVVAPVTTTTYQLTATATDKKNQIHTVSKQLTVNVVDLCYVDDENDSFVEGYYASEAIGDFIAQCNGQAFIGNQATNQIELRNLLTGELIKQYPLPSRPDDIELDERNNRLYVALPVTKQIAEIDIKSEHVDIVSVGQPPFSLSATGRGDVFFTTYAYPDFDADLYSLSAAGAVALVDEDIGGNFIRYVPKLDRLIVGGYMLARFSIDATSGLVYEDSAYANGGQELQVSRDSAHVVLVAGGGNGSSGGYSIYDYSATDFSKVAGEWDTGPYPNGAAFSVDSRKFAATNYDSVVLFDVQTHAELKRVNITTCLAPWINKVGFSRGGKYVFAKEVCSSTSTPSDAETRIHYLSVP